MLKLGQPRGLIPMKAAPPTPQPPAPADGPPPALLAALAGGAPPPDDPTSGDDSGDPSGGKFDAQKVDPSIARYLPPGSTCDGCQFFDDGSCELVSGKIDPKGICSLFTPVDSGSDDESTEPPVPTDAGGPPDAGPAPLQ